MKKSTVSKLSRLQRTILAHAGANRAIGVNDDGTSCDLLYAEAYMKVWGLRPHFTYELGQTLRKKLMWGGWLWRDVDRGRFQSIRSSLCRAIQRLERRGLVRRWYAGGSDNWVGISLTDNGTTYLRETDNHLA
jgi:hypothetical protein